MPDLYCSQLTYNLFQHIRVYYLRNWILLLLEWPYLLILSLYCCHFALLQKLIAMTNKMQCDTAIRGIVSQTMCFVTFIHNSVLNNPTYEIIVLHKVRLSAQQLINVCSQNHCDSLPTLSHDAVLPVLLACCAGGLALSAAINLPSFMQFSQNTRLFHCITFKTLLYLWTEFK